MTLPAIGMHLYVRQIRPTTKPKDLAALFSDNGMAGAVFAGVWQDPGVTKLINRPARLAEFAKAFRAEKLSFAVWGYPNPAAKALHPFIQRTIEIDQACGGMDFFLLNPEKGWANQEVNAHNLGHKLQVLLQRPYGVVSFALPGPAFPIRTFAYTADFGSPELYNANFASMERSVASWVELMTLPTHAERVGPAGVVIPSAGIHTGRGKSAVPKTPEQLHEHLSDFVTLPHKINTLFGWSYEFMGKGQWKVLSRFGDWLERGVCAR